MDNHVINNLPTISENAMTEFNDFGDDLTNTQGRRRRQLVPSDQKDDCYWLKRRKNNEAARRSREKRRANDLLLERRLTELQKENAGLKAQIYALRLRYGEIGYPMSTAQMQQNQLLQLQDQLAQQQAQTQAALANAALPNLGKVGMSDIGPSMPKRQKVVQEVLLPDGRKMALDVKSEPLDMDKPMETKPLMPTESSLQPTRVSSPTPSESNSDEQVIVDDDSDSPPVILTKSSSSGVSSDNESHKSVNKSSDHVSVVDDKSEDPGSSSSGEPAPANSVLHEYYKQQLAALYAQQPSLLGLNILGQK